MWLGYDEQAAITVAVKRAKRLQRTKRHRDLVLANCAHRVLEIRTEKDRCSWVECCHCDLRGPKKHSVLLALLAWAVFISSDHPKRRKA